VAKQSREQRLEIATTRLIRALRDNGVASMRTLEMKISDAGPYPQRIDPHILTEAREKLRKSGRIVTISEQTRWYHLAETPSDVVKRRLDELRPIQIQYNKAGFPARLGQALEIATFKALGETDTTFLGRFPRLSSHDDTRLYEKEEPPGYLGSRAIPDARRLDFIALYGGENRAGIECKNIREWIYPDRSEIRDLIDKCLYLDCIPVLIARRIHPSTFFVLNRCGLIIHQTYSQILPWSEGELAAKARDKSLLSYHDLKVGSDPDPRLRKFIRTNLPTVLGAMRPKWLAFRDLLEQYARQNISYPEFAARVRRRHQGTSEESDWEPDFEDNDEDWEIYDEE
jgi:hypothetical protein